MRIRRIQLVGLAAVLAGGAASTAQAQDLTITTSGHAPVTTSTANPGPGNVTINSGGSIVLTTAGTTGITVNDSHNATINSGGTISSNNLDNTTGIHVLGGLTSTITNAGSITLLEDHTLDDTDSDGDLDGEFAVGMNRYGILVDAGTMNGDIINSGSITVEGNNSAGILLNGLIDGDVNLTGNITSVGESSYGVRINGGVTGDVFARGGGSVNGKDSVGLEVNGPISGGLYVRGIWSATGYLSTFAPVDQTHLEPGDIEQGGSPIAVHGDVLGGVLIEGVGVEDDVDDDDDGITEAAGDSDDDATADIRQRGTAPAVDIAATTGNITLGATASGWGFYNRGFIAADSVYDNLTSTAVRITGVGGNTVTTANGVANDSNIGATSHGADAIGVYIGQDVTVPTFQNRRNILGTAISSDIADHAYGVYFATGSNVSAVVNSGIIAGTIQGNNGNGVAIYSASNSLTSLTNSGTIIAAMRPITGVVDPNATITAIDTRNSTAGLTINQIADTPFDDDDTVDDDATTRPDTEILGDIRFSLANVADHINLQAGKIEGNIFFGGGADTFTIDNGATYEGILDDSGGDLTLTVTDGLLNLRGGNTQITGATFGADGRLRVLLSGDSLDPPVLVSSGTITFLPGATISLNVPAGLPQNDTQTFLQANGGLSGWSNVIGPITGDGTPYLYALTVAATNPMAADGAPNGLEATYAIKTAAQLGLSQNEGNAFDAVLTALRTDTNASNAILSLDNADDFQKAYAELMPNYASGATELAATAIQQMQSATSNRLASTRLHGLNEVSAWGQEIGYGLTRTPDTNNGVEFRGSGFGFAGGIDGPLDNGAIFGLSASFLSSEVEEPRRSDGEISANFGQLNAYLGTAMGVFDLDFVLGGGAGKLKSRRFVAIGDEFNSVAGADWWGFEGHGSARASMPLSMGSWLVITPQAQLTYVALQEQGYTEGGGGTAVDLDVDDAFSQRLWADVGIEFSANFRMRGEMNIAPRVYLGYRANTLNSEPDRTYRFVSGGPDFTLTDESLGDGGPLVGIGIDASNGYSTFSISYEGEFSDQIERHSLNAAVRFRF